MCVMAALEPLDTDADALPVEIEEDEDGSVIDGDEPETEEE